jgi:hypothetical protein
MAIIREQLLCEDGLHLRRGRLRVLEGDVRRSSHYLLALTLEEPQFPVLREPGPEVD